MAQIKVVMPKMGESVMEATILNWVVQPGDSIEMDDTLVEIATDKVDSEVPSPADGVVGEIFFKVDDVVPVGEVICTLLTDGDEAGASDDAPTREVAPEAEAVSNGAEQSVVQQVQEPVTVPAEASSNGSEKSATGGDRFYSPLVRNIARQEGIGTSELARVSGTGRDGRVTKNDILTYIENRSTAPTESKAAPTQPAPKATPKPTTNNNGAAIEPLLAETGAAKSLSGGDEIIEMDRMRKLIAEHMVKSKRISPHVTSFLEIDVTNVVNWRNKVKAEYQERHGSKITFTPIFIEAIAKAIRDFPMINVSVDGTQIIVKKDINVGMAAALPSGNLIVPVIKNADRLNLVGITEAVNDLASRARNNQLKPDEIQGGTFTMTNVGTFGNTSGMPIINQPQVAILSVGAIKKKPAVLETEHGDVIAVRHMMYLSLSYDHRVVDGFLGGSFLRRVGDYLEQFDTSQRV